MNHLFVSADLTDFALIRIYALTTILERLGWMMMVDTVVAVLGVINDVLVDEFYLFC